MAGNDLCVAVCHGQSLFGSVNHAADGAARAFIDEGIQTVEPGVAHVQHIGFVEVNVDVSVSVRRVEVDQIERVAVAPDVERAVEGDCRPSASRSGRRSRVKDLHSLRRGEPLTGIPVSEDGEAGGVQALIATNVVGVPVGIDQNAGGGGNVVAGGGDGIKNARNRRGKAGIDKNTAFRAGLQSHVAALALEQVDIVVEFSGLDWGIRGIGMSLSGPGGDGGGLRLEQARSQKQLRLRPRPVRGSSCDSFL